MPDTLSIAEAREQLMRLPDQFAQDQGTHAVTVTRHGKPVLAILPYELYESIMESLEILGDAEAMAALHESAMAIARGETTPWDDVKRELGLA